MSFAVQAAEAAGTILMEKAHEGFRVEYKGGTRNQKTTVGLLACGTPSTTP